MSGDGPTAGPEGPLTLAFDIGGTGLKGSVVDRRGQMLADRVRSVTRYPMPPTGEGGMVPTLVKLASSLPRYDRVSAGFPGMVRQGRVWSAPAFSTKAGHGSPVDPDLVAAWRGFDMAAALAEAFGAPARVANDADVQGLAVVAGHGLELVLTLGTGFGTAVFLDGELLPHLEIAHQPFRKGETYNEQLGERTRKDIGDERWSRRVRKAAEQLDALFFYERLYIGGGNARRLSRGQLGAVAEKTSFVENTAGILGGVLLWEGHHLGVERPD